MFNKSFSVFLHPAQELPKEKANASFGAGFKNYLIGGIILGVLGAISTYLMYTVFISMIPGAALMGGIMEGMAGSLAISTFVGAIIGAIIGPFIIHAIFLVVARVLGGTGSYMEQYYMVSTYYIAYAVIAGILMLIPVVGSLIGLLVGLYALYVLTIALKETHGFDMMKAVLTWLIPVIVIGIIIAVLMVAIASLLASMGLGALAGLGGMPSGF